MDGETSIGSRDHISGRMPLSFPGDAAPSQVEIIILDDVGGVVLGEAPVRDRTVEDRLHDPRWENSSLEGEALLHEGSRRTSPG